MDNDAPIPALIGPTGCGKSALAAMLAETLNGEIVSMDSGAIYRDMNIGTATPPPETLGLVRHHLIDIVTPAERYNVGNFYRDAVDAINDIQARGKLPLIVGGTMMWLNNLKNGLTAAPPASPEAEISVADDIQRSGLPAAHKELSRLDAASARQIAVNDQQRIHRALAVYRATGLTLSDWKKRPPLPPLALNLLVLLPHDRQALKQRLQKRLDAMWAAGLEAETRAVLERWRPPADANALRLVGYKQAAAKIRDDLGNLGDAAMRAQALTATNQLVKRQTTWLRQWRDCPTFDPLETSQEKLAAEFARRIAGGKVTGRP